MMERTFSLVFCALGGVLAVSPCLAGASHEHKNRMTMAEKKETSRRALESRREAARLKVEERRMRSRSKAGQEADELAAQQAAAEQRHAEEMAAAEEEAKRQRSERERSDTLADREKSAALRARLRFRKAAVAHFEVKTGEEWVVHTGGLKAFALLDEAQKYVKFAAEDEETADSFVEELEEDTMIFVNQGGHLTVKATNAESILPSVGEMREPAEGVDSYTAFDTREGAFEYLKQAAMARGLVRVFTRRKQEFWVLYRDLLKMATPPAHETEPNSEVVVPAANEGEERDYEYGDDLI